MLLLFYKKYVIIYKKDLFKNNRIIGGAENEMQVV